MSRNHYFCRKIRSIMRLLYLMAIKIYHRLVYLVAPFHRKARLFSSGRKGTFRYLEEKVSGWRRVIWFHCASLGEFEQGRPLIELIRQNDPEAKILLTFFSPSGYVVRKDYSKADCVAYLPADTPRNARRFISLADPEKVFFIKYEYWYFFLKELHRRGIPTYLVSAIFREEQVFFRWYGRWFRRLLDFYSHIFVQDDGSKKLLHDYSIDHVSVSGDTRFDRVKQVSRSAPALPLVEKFAGGSLLLVAGSTWPADEKLLIRYFRESGFSFKMILAPHEVHPSNIQRMVSSFYPHESVTWSEASEERLEKARILIIDSIGMLSSLYGYGRLAYVGGGFGKGIHNILEAAAYGIPVVFGPNHEKFKEAVDLKEKEGAFAIREYEDLSILLDDLMGHSEKINDAGKIAGSYVDERSGSVQHIWSEIFR